VKKFSKVLSTSNFLHTTGQSATVKSTFENLCRVRWPHAHATHCTNSQKYFLQQISYIPLQESATIESTFENLCRVKWPHAHATSLFELDGVRAHVCDGVSQPICTQDCCLKLLLFEHTCVMVSRNPLAQDCWRKSRCPSIFTLSKYLLAKKSLDTDL
jgi:hypothetical protein